MHGSRSSGECGSWRPAFIVCISINSACVTKIAKWTCERFELEARIRTKLLQDAAFSLLMSF